MSRNQDCEILCIANQKGGVGKTTTSINLATCLSAVGKKVLIIDFDPQGNASTGLGIDQTDRKISSYDIMANDISLNEATIDTKYPNLSIIPAIVDLTAIDIELANAENNGFILKDIINDSDRFYDYIIIDTPPSLGLLTINALASATGVLVPLQCEFYALEGLAHLLKTIDAVQQNMNPALDIFGVLLTMYDKRNRITLEVEQDVRAHLGDKTFTAVIPRNVRLSEAPSHGLPAIIYDHRCVGSRAYLNLAREVLNRTESLKEAA